MGLDGVWEKVLTGQKETKTYRQNQIWEKNLKATSERQLEENEGLWES